MSEGRPERGGIFEFLKKVPLFADLPKDDLLHLCREAGELELAAGQELFAEGSAGDEAYVIKDGELEVLKGIRRPKGATRRAWVRRGHR